MNEAFDDIIREYIDFVNRQVGVYMDALAGFAGHHTRVEPQVHRISRAIKSSIDNTGQRVVVRASYEDPAQPDVVHNRIIRASDYIAANSEGGSNGQQHSQAVLVFLYAYWDEEIGNRYSYYYARMEAGLFSPIFGFILFMLSSYCIIKADIVCYNSLIRPSWNSFIICAPIVLISIIVLSYCPVLFREINDLECIPVKLAEDRIVKEVLGQKEHITAKERG